MYLVNPSYSLIKPSESIEITFTYLSKDFIEDFASHKFKFQAVSILPEYSNLQPKQIFEAYTKGYVKDFKTDEKGLRVALHKIYDTQSNLIPTTEGAKYKDQPAAAYQNVSNTIVNSSVYDNSFDQSDLLVASGKKENLFANENDTEKVKAEMINLNYQLKILQSNNVELNAKIKAATEQPKTSIFIINNCFKINLFFL